MAWYDPGREVVCIDDRWYGDNWLGVPFPLRKGEVYTVESVCRGYPDAEGPKCEITIRLIGISNKYNIVLGREDVGFALTRFRPVKRHNRSAETGMRVLREIASRKRQTVDAPNLEDA